MKQTISLLLALIMLLSAVPVMTVSAEEEAEKAFVIDGVLDEWYRDDEWAMENNCYLYFNSIDDTMLEVISREFGNGMGELDLPEFYEAVKVKIYAAYDDHYAYLYVDVEDPHIASEIEGDTLHQQLENLDFYVDTDLYSCDPTTNFFTNEPSLLDADTHFRMMAYSKVLTDMQGEECKKYTYAQETDDNTFDYFSNTANCYPFHKTDDNGNLVGYGCEVRFPLASYYDPDSGYTEFYYNIAVTNSVTDMDPMCCAITTGKRWWMSYDTGKTVTYDVEQPNPFFNKPDPDQIAASAVDAKIEKLPAVEELDVIQHQDVVEEARAAYEALTETQKGMVTKLAVLEAAEARIQYLIDNPPIKFEMGDVTMDETVNASDALLVLKAAVGKATLTEEETVLGDMNEDGKLDAADALAILKKAVGK